MSILVGPRKDGSVSESDYLRVKNQIETHSWLNQNGKNWLTNTQKYKEAGQPGYVPWGKANKIHQKVAAQQYAHGETRPGYYGHAIAKGVQEAMEDYYPGEEKANPYVQSHKTKGPDGRLYD